MNKPNNIENTFWQRFLGGQDMDILTEISETLQRGKARTLKKLVQQAIDEGIDAYTILEEGLLAGMNVIGSKFKKNEVYVPDVLLVSSAMNAASQLLKPLLAETGTKVLGKVVLGTVQGDVHDIGKNLVKMMMEGKGLEVIDIGIDVPAQKYIDTAIETGAGIIAASALLTTTIAELKKIVAAAEKAGIRDKVKIMVGGAPVTEEVRKNAGADIYTPDAVSAAEAAVRVYVGN